MPTIRPGDVLADRYLLIDLLGETGDGRFWRAHDRVLARHVAVFVSPAGTPRAATLLEAARGCARLTDRRFLRVLDAEVKAGMTYVVTEWGTGTSLLLMLQHAPLAPRRAAWMVGEVAGAMAAAHAVGVTHGRLAPENVLVDLSGSVRVVGAQVDAALKGLLPATERDDVHEIVSLLYAGLTGRWPGRSPSEMPAAPLDGHAVLRPRQVRAGIPRVLDELCDDVLNAPDPPRAPYDLTTARGIADYLREYVGDPAGMAAAEAERGTVATGAIPAVSPTLLTPLPPVLPHDARNGATAVRPGAAVPAAPTGDPLADPLTGPAADPLGAPTAAAPAATSSATSATPAHVAKAQPGLASSAVSGTTAATPAVPAPGPVTAQHDDEGATSTAERAAVPADAADAADSERPSGEGASGERPAGRPNVRAAQSLDVPTQAGVPIFHEGEEGESGDVSWLAKRAEPPPPPPDFEPHPERPLFAPETPEQIEARRRAQEAGPPPVSEEFWPWATGHTTGAVLPHPVRDPGARKRTAPGRSWLQLAGFLGALVALLLVVAILYQFVGPSDDGGGGGSDEASSGSSSSAPAAAPEPLTGLTATSIDPQGDGEERENQVANVLDGDAGTSWTSERYFQQLGPGGLKTGVGLQLDLGESREVREVQLDLAGSGAAVAVYLGDDAVDDVEDLEPVATGADLAQRASLAVEGGSGRYLTLWFTALPTVEGGFRAEVAEVRVLG
ncbi:hypothetical protein ACOACO_02590 [Nocardioides sp. CPCC 205120]|uniref:hypothetical protein n=1 Tax=Nocardioides sp. CPCC 205120 TaxID=3406462 RepID=UPI003B513B63